MIKIAITTTTFGEWDRQPIQRLEEKGFEVISNPHRRPLESHEVSAVVADSVGMIAGTEPLNREVLRQLSKLKVLSRCGSGLDNVDLKAAEELGIRVFSTPAAPIQAVAELTVALMIDLVRGIPEMNAALHQGIWKKRMGNLIGRQKVGILGFGGIGRKVAELLTPFGTEMAFYDINLQIHHNKISRKTLDEILAWADLITVHCSSSGESKFLLDRSALGKMKKGSRLVNTSRGDLVDEGALYDALKTKALSGAALDVYRTEPYHGPLRGLDNVILTPHIGSYAREARIAMECEAVENLIKGLQE